MVYDAVHDGLVPTFECLTGSRRLVLIRMELQRQLSVFLLQIRVCCILFHTQHFVVIFAILYPEKKQTVTLNIHR